MTGSDERIRELERAWSESGTVDDEAAWLSLRRRAGQLDEAVLVLAARLGHEAARRALGVETTGAPPDVDPLELLLDLEQGPTARLASVAAIVIAWAESVVVLWRLDGLDDAPARGVVQAAARCLRHPFADHIAEIEVAQAVLEEAWVDRRSSSAPSRVWGRARHLVHAAGFLAIDAALLHVGDAPRHCINKNNMSSWSSSAERLLGSPRRRDVARAAIAPRLLRHPPGPEFHHGGELVLPARPPVVAALDGLRGDLRWAQEHLASALTLRASDPARADEELDNLRSSLRSANDGLARVRALIAAWDRLHERSVRSADTRR